MSLLEALRNGSPLVWIDSVEPEKIIAQIPALCENRTVYVMDVFDGLKQWFPESKSWKIVLVTVEDDEGNKQDVPIFGHQRAQAYVMGQKDATYIMRNVHKDVDDPGMLAFLQGLWGRYRDSFWSDTVEHLPLQVVCLATGTEPPEEVRSMFTQVKYGLPTKSEIATLVSHMQTHIKTSDIIGDQSFSAIVDGFAGLPEHQIIETSLAMIRESGKLDAEAIAQEKFNRFKSHSSLDIAKPHFTLDDIGGLNGAKALITQAKYIRNNPDKAQAFGLRPIRRVMLVGISGCGKSLICEAAAHELGLDLAKVGVSKAMSKFVGQSEANIRRMFAEINALSPIMAWIDEGGRDLSGGGSSDVVDAGTTSRVHGTFLTEMQELSPDVFVFTAANDISSLSPEMLRADRFDRIMFVGFPSYEERQEIFRLNLASSAESIFDFGELAAHTACFTGAEIKALVNRVRLDVSISQDRHITTKDIIDTIPLERNRIWIRHHAQSVAMYRQAYEHYEWASDKQYEDAKYIIEGRLPLSAFVPQPKAVIK